MVRRLTSIAVFAFVAFAIGGLTLPASAATAGGCQLAGQAAFSPGLTNTAQNFSYSFGGSLTGCQSTELGSPASGTVSAGQVFTAPSGQRFQEPAASGNGSCADSTTSGIAIASWADGTQTVVSYSTTGVGAAVNLSGTVVPSVTLPAIDPQPGQPTSLTVTSTRYAGSQAHGQLTFQADPTRCAGAGVTSAGIGGAVELGSTS
jgi:hypothetical protein